MPANLLDGYRQDGTTDFRSRSYAAFSEVNYALSDRLTVTGGLRYTVEQKRGSYETSASGGLTTTNAAFNNAKLSIIRPQSYAARDRDSSLSGRANIAYKLTGASLIYLSAARAFKSGGINMSGLPLDAANQPVLATAVVRPERNITCEAGVKAGLLDDHLTINLWAFATDVRNFQATIVDSTQTIALRGYLSNIPKVTVRGLEGELVAEMTANLRVRAEIAYAHCRYARYPKGPCPLELQGSATTACDLSGERLSGLPRWAGSLGVDYHRYVGAGHLLVQADASWRSSYYGEPALSRYSLINGYVVVNGRLGYRSTRGWEVALFTRNLFNKNYIQNLTIQVGNSGLILATPSDPRVIGMSLGFNK